MHAGLSKKLIDQSSGVAAAFTQDQLLAGECVSADGALLAEAMPRRSNRHQLIFTESFCLDSPCFYRQRDKSQIHFACQNLLDQRLTRTRCHGQIRAWMSLANIFQNLR